MSFLWLSAMSMWRFSYCIFFRLMRKPASPSLLFARFPSWTESTLNTFATHDTLFSFYNDTSFLPSLLTNNGSSLSWVIGSLCPCAKPMHLRMLPILIFTSFMLKACSYWLKASFSLVNLMTSICSIRQLLLRAYALMAVLFPTPRSPFTMTCLICSSSSEPSSFFAFCHVICLA